ncbi:hypothetical protein XAP7430_60004 [Xanthomonas phaseoli pv. phaseoli]|uniref:Uncharacterized protein n=1 Tax=Xanthomonas campestris pv. phaseoli TaxID=317013 RepID=A0AB38E521_XANCH|nr:hypothetical protein XAP6984_80004 [Xanthomonas phaseoli pv. phaseoli]SON91570.1 hypothetical protein XAP7430_60004 [Xanthomonas phaseoli pv. phaseoli]
MIASDDSTLLKILMRENAAALMVSMRIGRS